MSSSFNELVHSSRQKPMNTRCNEEKKNILTFHSPQSFIPAHIDTSMSLYVRVFVKMPLTIILFFYSILCVLCYLQHQNMARKKGKCVHFRLYSYNKYLLFMKKRESARFDSHSFFRVLFFFSSHYNIFTYISFFFFLLW